MAEARKTVELVSKDGKRTWSTSNAVEITNLRAQGWQEKSAYDKAREPKPAASAAKPQTSTPKKPVATKAAAPTSTK